MSEVEGVEVVEEVEGVEGVEEVEGVEGVEGVEPACRQAGELKKIKKTPLLARRGALPKGRAGW